MKRLICLGLLMMLLGGCAATETFETVEDDVVQSVMAPVGKLELTVPDHASAPVIHSEDGGKLYLCDGYTLTEQILQGGDISKSIRNVCGFEMEDLTVMQTQNRYEWVWSAAGEGGEQLGRAVLLDDGAYHYCVCVMAEAELAGALQPEWDSIFRTVTVSS